MHACETEEQDMSTHAYPCVHGLLQATVFSETHEIHISFTTQLSHRTTQRRQAVLALAVLYLQACKIGQYSPL